MNRSLLLILLFFMPAQKIYASEAVTHADPIAPTLLALIAILAAAKLGGELFERLKMPAVLGELIAGMILGNLILINAGWSFSLELSAVCYQLLPLVFTVFTYPPDARYGFKGRAAGAGLNLVAAALGAYRLLG